MQRVQTEIFVFSCHFPCYNRVTRNIKNSDLLVRIQNGDKENSAVQQKGALRAILQLCWTALKTNRCKKRRIYNSALKLARFIHTI